MKNRHPGVRLWRLAFLLFAGLCPFGPLHADMGAIHLNSSNVTVSEPAQKAIILHNGFEEILILETDLKASARTDILRFIPFPAEPKVALAPENALREMGKLVEAKKLQVITVTQTKGGSSTHGQPVAEVVSRAKLGAHDLTVVKINDVDHFSHWVQERFKDAKELRTGPELDRVARIAADYVKDGISYFVFDFVTIDDTDKSVAPVAFRFKTRKIYYPLRTSNTMSGQGQVQLFFLAIDCVQQPYNWEIPRFVTGPEPEFPNFRFSSIADVKPEEAASIYPEAVPFFDGRRIVLQSATYSGPLKFDRDLHSFMLTHYDPTLYRENGAVQNSAFDPGELFSGLNSHGFHRENPVFNAERLERQRREMIAFLTGGSFHIASAGKKIQFQDGGYKDDDVRVEIDRLAFGDLNGDIFPDGAMITETSKIDGETCELTVFTGKSVAPPEKSTLEWAGSVPLKSCRVVDFSISDNKVKIVEKGGSVESFELLNGELTPAR